MLPVLIMVTMYAMACSGLIYMVERKNGEYPYDLIIGFFAVSLWFTLAIQWYAGWTDFMNGGLVTITNYYMASWTGVVAIMTLIIWLFNAYRYIFHESKDVTI